MAKIREYDNILKFITFQLHWIPRYLLLFDCGDKLFITHKQLSL